jgi:hypothetical protein
MIRQRADRRIASVRGREASEWGVPAITLETTIRGLHCVADPIGCTTMAYGDWRDNAGINVGAATTIIK